MVANTFVTGQPETIARLRGGCACSGAISRCSGCGGGSGGSGASCIRGGGCSIRCRGRGRGARRRRTIGGTAAS